jgi:hypothetical protein
MKYFASALTVAAIFAYATSVPAHAMDPKPRSAKSIECSKRADEKGLHGKARHKFRSECKHGKM